MGTLVTATTHATAWVVLVVLLLAITVADVKTLRIPNTLNAALVVSGFAFAGTSPLGLGAALAGAALGGAFLLGVALAYRRLRGFDGLGFGDIKFLVGAGAWTGWQGVGPLVFVAAIAALLSLGALRLAGSRPEGRTPIPFAPYLCAALLIVRSLQEFDILS